MKKAIAVILAVSLVFCLTGCVKLHSKSEVKQYVRSFPNAKVTSVEVVEPDTHLRYICSNGNFTFTVDNVVYRVTNTDIPFNKEGFSTTYLSDLKAYLADDVNAIYAKYRANGLEFEDQVLTEQWGYEITIDDYDDIEQAFGLFKDTLALIRDYAASSQNELVDNCVFRMYINQNAKEGYGLDYYRRQEVPFVGSEIDTYLSNIIVKTAEAQAQYESRGLK